MLSSVKISGTDCSMLLYHIKKQKWYLDNSEETKIILAWILEADEISNYIFDDINQISRLLEETDVSCDSIREKMIAKGKSI